VPTGERKFRAIVQKFHCGLPSRKIMARLARGSKLTAVLVAMAPHALLREPQKSFDHANSGIIGEFISNVLRMMAGSAGRPGVFALQAIAGLLMVKMLLTALPADECKARTVMLTMTRSTGLRPIFTDGGRVKPARSFQSFSNRSVAMETFGIAGLLSEFVTGQALSQPFEPGMRFRKGTRRNLPEGRAPQRRQNHQNPDRVSWKMKARSDHQPVDRTSYGLRGAVDPQQK